jgi:hypothetical protein
LITRTSNLAGIDDLEGTSSPHGLAEVVMEFVIRKISCL